jgi:hypothetical protein
MRSAPDGCGLGQGVRSEVEAWWRLYLKALVSVLIGVGRAGAACNSGVVGPVSAFDRIWGWTLASSSPSLRRWPLDPVAGGHCSGWFGGCQIQDLLGASMQIWQTSRW